jgi:hypothetical protein
VTPGRATGIRAAALAALALGWPAGDAGATLTWDGSIGTGVKVDDNLHFDPKTPVEQGRRQPVKETIFSVSPGVRVSWDEGRDLLHLRYDGEYQRFSGDEERDPLWLHDLSAELQWRRWAPLLLEARERRQRVPRTQQQDTEAIVDQIDRNLAVVRAGIAQDLGGRGAAELVYHGELENYPGVDDADRVLRHAGEGLWRYRWSPLWQTELRASYGWVDRELSRDFTEARAAAAVDQRLSERVHLAYSLEWVREADDEPSAGEPDAAGADPEVRTSLLKAAALDGTLERGGGWRLRYEDRLEGLPEGDTLTARRGSADVTLRARLGSFVRSEGWYEKREYRNSGREETAWGPLVAARWVAAPRVVCEAAGSWTDTKIREPGQEEYEDRTTRVAAGVLVLLLDRVSLEGGYAYRKNDSTAALRSYADNLIYALLTLHLRPIQGSPPATYASGLVTQPGDEPGQTGAGGGTGAGAGAGH